MKQIFQKLAMTVAVLLSFLPASAYDFEVDGIYYNITDATNQKVEVTYKGSGTYWGDIIIPLTVTNAGATYTVISIGDGAFNGCQSLTSITIPNSVISIGNGVFEDCTGLRIITIPHSVTSIGDYAFYGCTGLTSVTIPNSVSSVGQGTFGRCTSLTNITIPNSATYIKCWAFYGCTGLTSVTIPNSVTSIEGSAFQNCTGLTSITIPSSVTSIGGDAFDGCPLELVYCNWKEPIESYSNVFSTDCYEMGTLYVPKGCAAKYRLISPWSKFKTILEDESLGVENIMENQPTGGYIVYDLQGVLRLKTDNIDEVNQLPAGLYIVNGKKMVIR